MKPSKAAQEGIGALLQDERDRWREYFRKSKTEQFRHRRRGEVR